MKKYTLVKFNDGTYGLRNRDLPRGVFLFLVGFSYLDLITPGHSWAANDIFSPDSRVSNLDELWNKYKDTIHLSNWYLLDLFDLNARGITKAGLAQELLS